PLAQSTLSKEVLVRNSIARMGHIPKVIEAAKTSLKNPPRVILETAIRQNRGAIGFYERGLFDLIGDTPRHDELKTAASKVAEALKDYQRFLTDDLLPKAKGDWRLGKERFAQKLVLELDAGLTAEQVFRDAEAEFDRVEREMYVIARQLWSQTFPK